MTKRFAEDTVVPISKTREEIAAQLARVGIKTVQWTDGDGQVALRFQLPLRDGQAPTVRYLMRLPTDAELANQARPRSWRPPVESKLAKLKAARGKREHRLILLWVKGTVELVLEKVHTIETALLPWMESPDGQTVAEVALPNLKALSQGAGALLPLPLAGPKALPPRA